MIESIGGGRVLSIIRMKASRASGSVRGARGRRGGLIGGGGSCGGGTRPAVRRDKDCR